MQMIIVGTIIAAAAVGLVARIFKTKKKGSGKCTTTSSLCDSCTTHCALKDLKKGE